MPPAPMPKSRALFGMALGFVFVLTLFRLAFLAHFEGLSHLGKADVLRALYLGFKFDIRWTAILLVPAWLLLKPGAADAGNEKPRWLPPLLLAGALVGYGGLVAVAMVDDRKARPWLLAFLVLASLYRSIRPEGGLGSLPTRWVWRGYALLALLFTLLCYFVDFGAYSYIHTRLNGTLLMFLQNPDISGQMVWQSYPVLRLLLLLAGLVALGLWALGRLTRALGPPPAGRGRRILARTFGSLLLLACIWGKWSRYPLRWGEAFEAQQSLHAHLALNPILFFLETRGEMDGGYDLEDVKATHAALAEYFGIPKAFDAQGLPTLRRNLAPRPQIQGNPNLVLIQLESLAAHKTSPFGNPADPTPYLQQLCAEGILFDRFNVVMENTSRSMFATLFGTADVSSVQGATRNPLLVDQRTILSDWTEYDKCFFLGGSANWAQIRATLKNNLKDIRLFEEGSFKSPVVDVWGISDVDLLQEANAHLREEKGPFFAYIQTSGNHPPFTIPKHHTSFVRKTLDASLLKAGQFEDNDEYNAVRLMDHALERYFEAARKEAYFANTIFVLWGDHGIPRGSTDPRFGDLTLAIHNVPLLIYAPGLLPAQRRHTVASQLDILPTLASLLGRPAWTQTLGKDLFDPRFAERSAAFTFTTFRRPPRIGLLQGDYYLNVEPDGRPRLFRTDEANPVDLHEKEPERTRRMLTLAKGFHAWSRYLLSHNSPGRNP